MENQQKGWKRQPTKVETGWEKQPSKRVKRDKDHGWGEPAPNKEIKHEGFGGYLNPKWQWPKGTVVQPLYEGWNIMEKYTIKKKKKNVYWMENPWKKH